VATTQKYMKKLLIFFGLLFLFACTSNRSKINGVWIGVKENEDALRSIRWQGYSEGQCQQDIISKIVRASNPSIGDLSLKFTNKNKAMVKYSFNSEHYRTTQGGRFVSENTQTSREKLYDFEINSDNLKLTYKYEGRDGNQYTQINNYSIKITNDTLFAKLIVDNDVVEKITEKYEEIKSINDGSHYGIEKKDIGKLQDYIDCVKELPDYKFYKIEDNE
jgi:hypothetical protein